MTITQAFMPICDPQSVPVAAVDTLLPCVDPDDLVPSTLRSRFLAPPRWEPEVRAEPRFSDRPSRDAAVLIPLMSRGDDPLQVLLTERTSHLSSHAGQIAFPGGRIDPEDADAVDAALREAQEEVGLRPSSVEVLGMLASYETGSAYRVTPVVGLIRSPAVLVPNPHEVADVFEVPLDFLMNPAHHRRHVLHREGRLREWFSIPYHDGRVERYIWGATAGMLRNLYRFLSA